MASYTEAQRAEALAVLALNKGNVSGTSKQLGVPAATVRLWRDGRGGVNCDVAEKCETKKEELADLFEKVARAYLKQALTGVSIEDTKGKDAVMASAIATDKMRLLRDQSTSNSHVVLTDDERAQRANDILSRGRLRSIKAA